MRVFAFDFPLSHGAVEKERLEKLSSISGRKMSYSPPLRLNPKHTAVLTLDMQIGVLNFLKSVNIDQLVTAASKVVNFARKNEFLLVHVGIGFEAGHPELPEYGPSMFRIVKDNKMFQKGSPESYVLPQLFESDDIFIYKHRVSAFTGNSLQLILQAHQITHLVLMGIATSGIVLSTLRYAADCDYSNVVIQDACADLDEEVDKVLKTKVFVKQARVISADEFLEEQKRE